MRIARISVAVLFLAMATGQIASVDAFVAAIDTYRLVGAAGAVLAVIVVVAEVTAGTLLVIGSRRTLGATLAVAVAAFWALMATQAFVRGLAVPNCGCFGAYLSQELRWWVLAEDAYLVALTVWVRRQVVVADSSPASAADAPLHRTN